MDSGAECYRRFLAGDDNGMVEIIRDYKDGLILFLNRYVNNISLAEELAEDTFFRIVTRKPQFQPSYSFKTWLYTIGRNQALNHLKRAVRISDTPIEDLAHLASQEAELERAYLREEQRIRLHQALSRLNPAYSQVLYLKFFEELTNEQIGVVLHKTRRQVENLTYQAKLALKAQLEQEDFSYEELSGNG